MTAINIIGNIESLKESTISELESLYSLESERGDFLPEELAKRLADLTWKINREISVYIDRKGNIIDISIGDNSTVDLPGLEGRRSASRLAGIRCVHTHPNGDGMLSAVDINSLLSLRLDAMTAIGVREGKATEIYSALPSNYSGGADTQKADIFGPFTLNNPGRMNVLCELIQERDKAFRNTAAENEREQERALLVGLETRTGKIVNGRSEGERSLDELEELAMTAGVEVVEKILQRKPARDAAYYIGKGKLEEINLIRQALGLNVIIFDDELTGAQLRNIEEVTGAKVVDRTTLILDIFAQRARSSEGKLQVELAQLQYRLPRLTGLGNELSRLGGGIGTRGPGEKKLEADRRHIKRRIHYLETEIENIGKRRKLIREGRRKNSVSAVAVVGYTNAGKSTLINALCNSSVFAENKLFATLDPTTRKLLLPDGRELLLTDTVGFIRKLPHELVDAFKSTLEEVIYADALIHVVDSSSEEIDMQIEVVESILESLGALGKPTILTLNKIDLVKDEIRIPFADSNTKVIEISAVTGEGMKKLIDGIAGLFPAEDMEISLNAPYSEGWIIPYIYENGRILGNEYNELGIKVKAIIKKDKVERVKEFTE